MTAVSASKTSVDATISRDVRRLVAPALALVSLPLRWRQQTDEKLQSAFWLPRALATITAAVVPVMSANTSAAPAKSVTSLGSHADADDDLV